MALTPGRTFGPYEIVAPLGAGAMGEVYRARDPRLARDVAIKILPSSVAADPDRIRRFETEARALGQLNHPNILSVYEFGVYDGSPCIVSELVEGATLRQHLAGGPVPLLKALKFALQIANGLAAAHERGIVHRDLKPENLVITRDERVKILDFGVAKLREAVTLGADWTRARTAAVGRTEPGVVLGTLGYMSPEQVRAQPVDHRSDIFSLGTILYEMVTGRQAFSREFAVETIHAILAEEPAALSEPGRSVPPVVERTLRRCLEKRPDARWQDARDFAFALEALLSVGDAASAIIQLPARPVRAAGPRTWAAAAAGLMVAVAVIVTAFQAGQRASQVRPPSFQRLTFGRGIVWSARFAPEGRTIVYSATWDGQGVELFSTRTDGPESRSLGISGADVSAISPSGEMALLLKPGSHLDWAWKWGTLARALLAGGAPRELLQGVQMADWSPDGTRLAVVRTAAGRARLEFPIGAQVYETGDRIGALRVSPNGHLVAFAERPVGIGSNWSIVTLDRAGSKQIVSRGWPGDFIDLAWAPAGDAIWFDTRQGGDDGLHAVTLAGNHRLLARMAVPVQLFDVSRDGRVLLARAYWRSGIIGRRTGETEETDLSWLDASEVDDISFDGKTLLITEFGEGGGLGRSSVYLRPLDGSPAVRLGDGQAFALSPDGTRALALRRTSPPELVLWPTGAGDPVFIKNEAITDYTWADWLPDGKRIFFNATERDHGPRSYVQDLEGGRPHAVTPEGTFLFLGQKAISPDGAWAAVIGPDGRASLYPVEGEGPRAIAGLEPGDVPIRWSADERSLFVFRKSGSTARVYLIDLMTGRNDLWEELRPADLAGIATVWSVHIAPDEKSYYYSYVRTLSDLYLVTGLK